MKVRAMVHERGGGELGTNAGLDARRLDRSRLIKPAQIAFGGSVLDCALLDTSPGGVRVHVLAHVEVHEVATLRLRNGESWTVQRRWQRGAQVGFEFVGTAQPPASE